MRKVPEPYRGAHQTDGSVNAIQVVAEIICP